MNFRKAILVAATATAMAAMASAASAQDAVAPSVTFNAGVSNDYVFRGVSQTNEDLQVFGGADISYGMFYGGVWASNVDFGPGDTATDAEYDFYAGFKPVAGPVTFDFGVIRYGYIGSPAGAGYDNWEFKAAASTAAGPGSLGAAVFYSPDGFGAADDAVYYEVNGSFPLAENFSVGGALGRQTYDGGGDYTTWNLGATYTITPNFAVDARYHDTGEHSFGKIYDSRFVLTLKVMLP